MQRKKKREENQKIKETEEMSHSFHPQTNIDKKELSPNGKKSIEYSENLYQRGVEDLKRRDDRTIARYQESQMMQQEGRFVPGTKLSTQMGIPPCLKMQRIGESRATASPTTSRAYLPGGKVWSKPDVVDHTTVAHREFTEEQDRKFQTFLIASQTQIQRQEEKKRKDIIMDDEEQEEKSRRAQMYSEKSERKARGKKLDRQLSQREAKLEAIVNEQRWSPEEVPVGWEHGVVR